MAIKRWVLLRQPNQKIEARQKLMGYLFNLNSISYDYFGCVLRRMPHLQSRNHNIPTPAPRRIPTTRQGGWGYPISTYDRISLRTRLISEVEQIINHVVRPVRVVSGKREFHTARRGM